MVVDDDSYFVLRLEGSTYLVRSRCAHRGGPLHLGQVDGGRLQCPWHGNRFRLDRLCIRAAPLVRQGSQAVAYLPPREGLDYRPGHSLVFAEGDDPTATDVTTAFQD